MGQTIIAAAVAPQWDREIRRAYRAYRSTRSRFDAARFSDDHDDDRVQEAAGPHIAARRRLFASMLAANGYRGDGDFHPVSVALGGRTLTLTPADGGAERWGDCFLLNATLSVN